ncbi:hypothetical protein [Nannocystis bainbridge]|uniref:Uncharacterized protein n=1 Tax=Nannocystis bainbridge TaxID=2995303 RepID=A0ABT5DW68_9BACT|nr:hypothetical protein [Nannocystis bainbridge]MDC0717339.1 hypothetical protein [Nannocystis bainbridge]
MFESALRLELQQRAAAGAGVAESVARICESCEEHGEVAGRFFVVRTMIAAFALPMRLAHDIAPCLEDRASSCDSLDGELAPYLRPSR